MMEYFGFGNTLGELRKYCFSTFWTR